MCYAIPGRVESVEGRHVAVSYYGQIKRAVNELYSLSPGDYVYAQGGFVVQKVSPAEAEIILSTWKELFFELQELDSASIRPSLMNIAPDSKLAEILKAAEDVKTLSEDDLTFLLSLEKRSEIDALCGAANRLRHSISQSSCCVHGIIEISNNCRNSCRYCGINNSNARLSRYRMSEDEILSAAREAVAKFGFKSLVLQSGEDCARPIDELVGIVRRLQKDNPVFLIISFGEYVGWSGLEALYDAGARGLLTRFETSNPEIFSKLHPDSTLEERLAFIRRAGEIGYLITSGGLVGLPGQNKRDLARDVLLCRELGSQMYSFGPFIPHPDTALAGRRTASEIEMLKVTAACRLAAPPEAVVPVTSAFETISRDARKKAMQSGANSLMLNLTPLKYRAMYSIYPSRAHESESLDAQIADATDLLKSLGRVPMDIGIRTQRAEISTSASTTP